MISIPFPEKDYQRYLSLCGMPAEGQADSEHAPRIFQYAVGDFERGAISSDGLGSIAGRLMQILLKEGKETADKSLFDALESTSELGYLLHKGDSSAFLAALDEARRFSKLPCQEARKEIRS